MRNFIVLCIFATASAASLGYDYGIQSGANNGFESVPKNGFNNDQGIIQNGPAGDNDLTAPAVGPTEFKKEYFTYSAPEGEFEDKNANPQLNNDLKRGLKVIFIKGPENSGLENAALRLAKSAVEQRTAIYVLNKEADIGDLAKKLNTINKNNDNKPEVHFVKYRTPDDAEHAKRIIQNQYDGLVGTSLIHDGVTAPVLNFPSNTPVDTNNGYAPAQPDNAYLPVSRFI